MKKFSILRFVGALYDTAVFVVIFALRCTETFSESITVQTGSHWYNVSEVYSSTSKSVATDPFFILSTLAMIAYLVIAYVYSFSKKIDFATFIIIKVVGYISAITLFSVRNEDYFAGLILIAILGIISGVIQFKEYMNDPSDLN